MINQPNSTFAFIPLCELVNIIGFLETIIFLAKIIAAAKFTFVPPGGLNSWISDNLLAPDFLVFLKFPENL